ncbi:MAG: hypothetical protein ACOVNZ_11130, partial [Crocinitomicaceae bacterium]
MINWAEVGKQFLYLKDDPLLFHQGIFLLIFSIFLIIYSFAVENKKWQHILIIGFSVYFYYKASGIFLLLLLLTISADYVASYLIEIQNNERKKKLILFVSILFSLSFLMYFKYKNFFLENLSFFNGKDYKLEK